MSIEGQHSRIVYSLDLDDVVVGRESFTRYMGVLLARLRAQHRTPRYEVPNDLEVNREIVDVPLKGLGERISYAVHARRNVQTGVRPFLEVAQEKGVGIYGNTGRVNKPAWVEMTRETLLRGGVIDFFDDIYFTPQGLPTAVSKAAGIRDLQKKYPTVFHVDDDPRTVVFLASHFPHMTLFMMLYNTSNVMYPRAELNKYENIVPIASLKEVGRMLGK